MRLVLLAAAAALLAACGRDEPKTTITGADGSKVTVTGNESGQESFKMESTGPGGTVTTTMAGAGAAWPASAPDYAAAYPGGRITSVVDGVESGQASGMATFETDDAPAEVVAFYKARAAAAKLDRVTNITADSMTMFAATDDKSERGVSIQVSAADGKTTGAVTFRAGKPG